MCGRWFIERLRGPSDRWCCLNAGHLLDGKVTFISQAWADEEYERKGSVGGSVRGVEAARSGGKSAVEIVEV